MPVHYEETITGGVGISFDGSIAIGDVALRSGAITLGKATLPGDSRVFGFPGTLPSATTAFFSFDGLQSTIFNPFVARGVVTINRLQIDSVITNGPGKTDTYTVFKNGVATTMVLAVTNANTGFTILNPVALVAGDRVALRVVSDTLTLATGITVTLGIS